MDILPIVSGLLIIAVLMWLVWLTLGIGRVQSELNESKDRSRFPSKELQRGTRQLESLREEVFRLARKIELLEDQGPHRPSSQPPLPTTLEKATKREDDWPSGPANFSASSSADGYTSGLHPIKDRSEEIVSAFNALAASFDQPARDDFVSRFGPEQCGLAGRVFRPDSGGDFWVVETGTGGDSIILPGGTVARDWDKFYRQMDGMRAREVFGECFDISDGGRLRIETPARGRGVPGNVELTARGRLSGV